jgi:type 1 glutamine amidotransferase
MNCAENLMGLGMPTFNWFRHSNVPASLAAILFALTVSPSPAQDRPGRILYFTHAAGYRHEVIPASQDIVEKIGATAGFEVTASEDIAALTAENLRQYGAVMFFTSGELPLSNAQRAAFMDFIRRGGGFLGVHSATDTLYLWPEYLKLIGGYFDHHPWHQ